jgi:phage major head subunit gpT-like protein
LKFTKAMRERLGRLGANPAELAKAMPVLCRASHDSPVLAVRAADGSKLTTEKRDELLAKAVAGEFVEVLIDVHSYDQKTGEQNRNFVRFRDGMMMSLGRTGRGNPFLRDHRQGDSLAVAGTINESATTKLGDGEYVVQQTAKLTAPWAVELALRGLLNAVSIGWNPTGPVLCSACDAPVFSKCYHFPGDRLKLDERGRKVYDDNGDIVVEFIFTEAELIETSMVPIGGVRTARIDEIRAGLSALGHHLGVDFSARGDINHGDAFAEEYDMDKFKKLIAILGLAATATEEEVLAAAANRLADANADKTELGIVKSELGVLKLEVDKATAEKKKTAEEKFITDALSSGRIAKGDEPAWRELFQASTERAEKLMADRQPNIATPAGAPRQSAVEPQDEQYTPAPVVRELRVEGGGIPGYSLYELGQRSKIERKEIARQVAAAVKALEMHPNPAASWWATRMGFEGKLRSIPSTLGATSIANSGDLDAARTAFRAAFMQALEMAPVSPMEMLFQTVPTNTPLAQINWFGDIPGFEEWIGDRKLSGVEAFKLNLQSKKWANGLRIKNDDVKFDNLGLMPSQIGGLATKGRRHRIDRMAGFMIDGFAGGTFANGLAYDGAFFFADAHRGGNDNKLAVALDAAGLTAAELLLESMTTYDGADALETHGSHLIVGPKLRATAEKLLTQERLANGEDNYHRGKYKLIVDNRFRGAADDYWFLGDLTHELKPFIYQLVEDISTSAVIGQEQNSSMPSFMNDELLFGAQANYNMAYFEFRLLVGSVVA